jgi:hypothetical protein
MIFPLIILGTCLVVIVSLKDNKRPQSSTEVRGNPVNLTSHLSEFTTLIRNGHRPSQWLINQAINEAYHSGDWKLAKAISDSYTTPIPEVKRKPAEVKKPEAVKIEEKEPQKQLDFNPSLTSSPVEGITNDDWRMFIEVSKVESPTFDKNNLIGMFRQNKKRLQKLGIDPKDIKTPVEQYTAFEAECVQLISEGNNLIKQSVAMPVEVDGESVPITLSGLLTVMHHAGVENAAKWLDSSEERKKFPNTTEAFKRSNGCF